MFDIWPANHHYPGRDRKAWFELSKFPCYPRPSYPSLTVHRVLLRQYPVVIIDFVCLFTVLCDIGEEPNANSSACVLCPIGRYQDTPGSPGCVSCPAGTTTDVVGANSSELCIGKFVLTQQWDQCRETIVFFSVRGTDKLADCVF